MYGQELKFIRVFQQFLQLKGRQHVDTFWLNGKDGGITCPDADGYMAGMMPDYIRELMASDDDLSQGHSRAMEELSGHFGASSHM